MDHEDKIHWKMQVLREFDDHTMKVWVYFMKHKGEVFQHFLNFKAMVEKEKGVSIKCLRSDGGGEYFSNEFSEYLKEHGM